ncbi:hypothetical protein [Mongoliitalea daihaiensis]|uniref:hypothetical protein n=1 Tax=Mongoliitalea daihaiensis TaxID=2782006 RepID=UPI001F214B67|nr:hypothetical protein [Mongoliitalea daihaiensis]UJP66123.1 outer membrane beta-barrel protein [Mongoliitalea daihaiensis]
MRYILLILIFFGLLASSMAQVEKGLWLISGQVNASVGISNDGFSTSSSVLYESSNFTRSIDFSPRLGYMLSDKWLVGVDVNFARLKFASEQLTSGVIPTSSQDWVDSNGLGIFTRGFFDMDENLQIFAEGRIGYSWWEQRFENNTTTTVQTNQTVKNYEGRLSVGLHYWMLPNLSLEIAVPFLTINRQEIDFPALDSRPEPDKQINRGIGFSFGQAIGIGFNFVF